MQSFGQLLLVLTFVAGCATLVVAVLGATSRRPGWMQGARAGLLAVALLSVAMAAVLTHGFLTHAFESRYISQYSDRSMPLVYLLASFWGGERGALLFWVVSLAVFSNIAVWTKRDREQVYMTWVTAILSGAILFFLMLMVFQTSPFDTWMVNAIPEDGEGLNPLLQNPVMAFHPPSLLTGYILFTIPFAFGMAALITGRLDDTWIADTRRWTIVSWTFLSVGLLLGCRWAYMEIGWGFWWMWDAVENAGLIPWFTATAYLHSVMIQERRGMLKRWNVVLLALTFLLTIFGTFLTRSQLIVSIHAFADSELSDWFLGYLVVIAAVSGVVIARRWGALRSEARIDAFMSREAMFVLNNVILVFCAFVTLYGTLMGKITESEAVRSALELAEPIVWDEAKFNEVFVPLGLGLLLIMGIGPLISWRRATARNFRKNFVWPLAWGSLVTFVGASIGIGLTLADMARVYQMDLAGAWQAWLPTLEVADWLSMLVYWMSAFVMASMTRELHLAARAQALRGLGGYFGRGLVIVFRNPRRYGGYVVHAGIVFMFVAFTGKAFKTEEKDRVVSPGETHVLGDYALTLVDRDRRYSAEDGCVITDATFVAMPLRTTVAEASVERLSAWLTARGVGAFHVTTDWDSPRMLVRFGDAAARRQLELEAFLVRRFLPRFKRQSEDRTSGTETWVFADDALLSALPMAGMQAIREARERLTGAVTGLSAESRGGSAALTLRFGTDAARTAFEAATRAELPPWVLSVADDAEAGALAVVDRGTGQVLVPESRFYARKGQMTTEVALSQADFLVDVYLSVQSDMSGAPTVKVFAVIFPLVNFLWIGGFLLLVGAAICLAPRWVGKTLASFFGVRGDGAEEGGAPVVGPTSVTSVAIVVVAVGAALLLAGEARAHEAPPRTVAPHGFPQPGPDPLAETLGSLTCGCPSSTATTLADAACACDAARSERALVCELLAGKGSRYEVLKGLVKVDGLWEARLRFDEAAYRDLIKTTRTTCPGEYLMTFDASRSTCEFKIRWLAEFRVLLAAGVAPQAIFAFYLAENNASMAERMNGGKPWAPHELRTSPDTVASWWVPMALAGGAVLVVLLLIGRNVVRRAAAAAPEGREAARTTLTESQRERLRDELELDDA